MRLLVASVGQKMPRWANEGWKEYARRMPRELPLELREIPLAPRGRNPDIARVVDRESKALLGAVPGGYRIIALDGSGQTWSTEKLAQNLTEWMGEGRHCAFLIGGPDGLSEALRTAADACFSLGRLTLPHPLVRVVLAEQLYRAYSINCNHPYHRA